MDHCINVLSLGLILWSTAFPGLFSMQGKSFRVLWSYHFSLSPSHTPSGGSRWSWVHWSIYQMLLSFFPLVSLLLKYVLSLLPTLFLTNSLTQSHTHTSHILFPITDVPFHQMKSKAKRWAFLLLHGIHLICSNTMENEARSAGLISVHRPGRNEQQLINLAHFSEMRKTSVTYVIQNVSTSALHIQQYSSCGNYVSACHIHQYICIKACCPVIKLT